MKERNLLKLMSNDECLVAYKRAFDSADSHKETAVSEGENGRYGIAVSHLILGTEEVVKGLLIRLQSLGFDVKNVPSIHLFFTDHIIKHQLAIYVSMMFPFIKTFMGLVHKLREEIHNPKLKIEYTPLEKAMLSRNEKRVLVFFKNLPEMLDWWDEANIKKNGGFYVDYTTSIETPMQVTKEEYFQAVEITEKFRSQINEIMEHVDRTTDEEKIELFKQAGTLPIAGILSQIINGRLEQRKKRI